MMCRSATRQRGAALLIMMMIVGLGATWYLVSRLNTESGLAGAAVKARNQRTLNTAKAALIGYVAAQAIKAGEDRPGALPCPEAPADFNVSASEGTVSYPCTLPIVGRFPWRTLGLDKLVDASGEPLWYAVASGWAGANTVINSDCASPASGMACATGRLTVDGATNDVIAIIVAPGPRLNVSASTNCAARVQARSTSGTPDGRDYLECQNATWPADATFATTGPSGSFNDQLVTITVSDLLPAVEAAVAMRIEREIVPALETVFTPAGWGFAGTKPLYPFAATFSNPGPGTGTSSYLGVAATYQGLLPFNQTNCTASAGNPRCLPTLIAFEGTPANPVETLGFGSFYGTTSCAWDDPVAKNYRECIGQYQEAANPTLPIRIEMTATLDNVAMGLRKFDATKLTVDARNDGTGEPWQSQPVTYTLTINNGSVAGKPLGSATITFGATVPNIDVMGWDTRAEFRIRVERTAITDHSLLDTASATTGWFARNEWFRVAYYAVAQGHTAGTLPPTCVTGGTGATGCLSVANVTPAGAQRAILILAGQGINGNSRPSSALADYLEFGNHAASYEKLPVTKAPTTAYADTGAANAYSIVAPVIAGRPLHFKAVNANTGASTLAATSVSATNLVNADGSSLTAAQIQANSVSEVAYDGTRFKLYKRPSNDRVIVIDSN